MVMVSSSYLFNDGEMTQLHLRMYIPATSDIFQMRLMLNWSSGEWQQRVWQRKYTHDFTHAEVIRSVFGSCVPKLKTDYQTNAGTFVQHVCGDKQQCVCVVDLWLALWWLGESEVMT